MQPRTLMSDPEIEQAVDYVTLVKSTFADEPEVYVQFFGTLSRYQSRSIDTSAVIEAVDLLFQDHPTLLRGFDAFLPEEYQRFSNEASDPDPPPPPPPQAAASSSKAQSDSG